MIESIGCWIAMIKNYKLNQKTTKHWIMHGSSIHKKMDNMHLENKWIYFVSNIFPADYY